MRGKCLLGLALCLAACGASATAKKPRRVPSPAVAQAQSTHEYPSPTPPPQAAAGGADSAVSAVAAFATAYINWNAQSVSEDMRRLAGRSVGQARAAMQLAAAQTASDYELQRGGVANQGTVEAVAAVRESADEYVVVTRELTTATATTAYQGLQPAWHIALATVAQLRPGQWVLTAWQPES